MVDVNGTIAVGQLIADPDKVHFLAENVGATYQVARKPPKLYISIGDIVLDEKGSAPQRIKGRGDTHQHWQSLHHAGS